MAANPWESAPSTKSGKNPMADMLNTAGGVAAAVGTYQQYQSQAAADEYNANSKRQQAIQVEAQATEAARLSRVRSAAFIGQQRANYGASGVSAASGSVHDVLASSATNAEMDALNIKHQGDMAAYNLNVSADRDDDSAEGAREAAGWGVATSILTTGAKALSMGAQMPEIKQYQQQENPSAGGAPAQASAAAFGGFTGRAMEGAGKATQDLGAVVYKRQVQSELSDIDVKMSDATAKLSQDLADKTQTGKLTREEFMKDSQEHLEALGEGIETREGQLRYNQIKAATLMHFSGQANAAQAHLAGTKAVADNKLAIDSDLATLHSDPSQMKLLLAKRKASIQDLVDHHGLPADQASKLQVEAGQTYAEAMLRGTFRHSPDLAQKILDDTSNPINNLLGEDGRFKMQVETDRAVNQKRIEEERFQKLQKEAAKAKEDHITDGWYNDLYKNGLSTDTVMFGKDSGSVTRETKEHFNKLIEARTNERIGNDNPTQSWAFGEIRKPYDDPTKKIKTQADIDQLYIDRKINSQGLEMLTKKFSDSMLGTNATEIRKFHESALAKDAYQQIVKPVMGVPPDPEALGRYYSWEKEAMDKMHMGQKDSSFKNTWLTDKKDPNYLGNYNNYQIGIEDSIKIQAARISNTDPKTGEEMVTVKGKDGKSGRMPKSKVDAARKAGVIE